MSTMLITGANKGLGFEAARRLVAAGHTVWVGSRDVERGVRAAAEIGARAVQLDVTDDASVTAAAATVGAAGGLDVLVNNAGIQRETDDMTHVVGPADVTVPSARRYLPGTLVLETSWGTPTGWIIVRDLLVMGPWRHEDERSHTHRRAPTDYDASRKTEEEQHEESREARRLTLGDQDKTSGKVDEDEAELAESYELPGADLSHETLSVEVTPEQVDEFVCERCFLVQHYTRRSSPTAGVCQDCA